MYRGGCLCGAIRFEIEGRIGSIVYCHCSQCRKAQGSAFATNGIVRTIDFRLCSGQDKLTAYESTPGQTKFFCKVCGSPIMSRTDSQPEQVRVRLGTIESDIEERPMAHIFATSKANWEEITGMLPQYVSYEPGRIMTGNEE
ncbi:MAG: GFA family protein [Sulfuricella denitrificans]|nr:GFA family protein [Sulfuricella denitrificans]